MICTNRTVGLALVITLGVAACNTQPGADSATPTAEATGGVNSTISPEDELSEGVNDPGELDEPKIETIAFDTSTIVPDGTVSADGKVTKDIYKWTLPTDPYIGLSHLDIVNAEQAFVQTCLKEKGIEKHFSPATHQVDPSFPDTNTTSNTSIFNIEVATRQGYGIGNTDNTMKVPLYDWFDELQANKDNDTIESFFACTSSFEQQYGWQKKYFVPNDNYQLPHKEAMAKEPRYAQNYYVTAVTTPERDKALADWRACNGAGDARQGTRIPRDDAHL